MGSTARKPVLTTLPFTIQSGMSVRIGREWGVVDRIDGSRVWVSVGRRESVVDAHSLVWNGKNENITKSQDKVNKSQEKIQEPPQTNAMGPLPPQSLFAGLKCMISIPQIYPDENLDGFDRNYLLKQLVHGGARVIDTISQCDLLVSTRYESSHTGHVAQSNTCLH